ncbi:MAG: hypothetical protein J5654_06485 [Victivallales bacterium]|nr:hypothetical protein [Victivallales bacterium]
MYNRFLIIALALAYGWPLWGLVKSELAKWLCAKKSLRLARFLGDIILMAAFGGGYYCGVRIGKRLAIGLEALLWPHWLFAIMLFGVFYSLDYVVSRFILRGWRRRQAALSAVWWMVFAFAAVFAVYPIPYKVLPGVREASGYYFPPKSIVLSAIPDYKEKKSQSSEVIDSADARGFWLHHYEGSLRGRRLIISKYPCGGLYIHYGSEARYVNICTPMYRWSPAIFQLGAIDDEILISVGTEYFIYNITENTLQQARPAAE